jgi:hypothetical protein
MMPEGKVAKINNYTAIYTQYTKIRLLTPTSHKLI